MSEHPTLPFIVNFPFLSRDSVHLFAADRSLRLFRMAIRARNATGTVFLINGKSTGYYIQRHKSKRHMIDDPRIKRFIISGYLIRDLSVGRMNTQKGFLYFSFSQ